MEKELPENAPEAGTGEPEGLQLSVMHVGTGEPRFYLIPLSETDNAGKVAERAKAAAGVPKKNKVYLCCQGVRIPDTRPVLAENDARMKNGKCAWELIEEEPRK